MFTLNLLLYHGDTISNFTAPGSSTRFSALASASATVPYVSTPHSAFSITLSAKLQSLFISPVLQYLNKRVFAPRYSSMPACSYGLIWSLDRFVNTPVSNSQYFTLSSASPCEDTSITTSWTPSSAIRAKSCCRSSDSGVVLSVCSTRSPILTPSVPIRPAFLPAASSMDLIMKQVVVLPFVPVTPIRLNLAEGCPKNLSDT